MEVTNGKITMQEATLADRVNTYLQANRISITALADEVNYSRSTLSRYLNGSYDSNPAEIEEKLSTYLNKKMGRVVSLSNGETAIARRTAIFPSSDASGILGVCKSCQKFGGLGIVVGKSGFGKTYALREYAKLSRVAYMECDDTMGSRDFVAALESALGLASGYGSVWMRVNVVREYLNTNPGYLLIIDEADKLISKNTQKKMEILRGIYDQSTVGMVIAGEPKLEAQIKSLLDRMANRIDFYTNLKGLREKEVVDYLADYEIDADALEELKRRAYGTQAACFRLLDRTMGNIIRLLNDRGEARISAQVIQEASRMMML